MFAEAMHFFPLGAVKLLENIMEEKTLTERVKRIEDILCLNIVTNPDEAETLAGIGKDLRSGCEESILGSVKDEPAWSARGEYVGPRTAYDEIGSRERFAEREKEQAWRNERDRAAVEGSGAWGSYRDEMQQTSFEEIMQRVQHCTDRVIGTAQRLEVIGTRVFGPPPESDTLEGLGKVNPDGTLDHTLLALNWLDGAIRRLEVAEARLAGI